jgi:osmotically inducible protein OsmC
VYPGTSIGVGSRWGLGPGASEEKMEAAMATFSRQVEVNWQGPLMEGKGTATAGTGAFVGLPVSFPARIGEPGGKTSPEELMAAAHASCYAMALNGTLGRRGASADKTVVSAIITADKGDAGITIQSSTLKVVAHGLKGLSADEFPAVAREAEGRCPVSNALRGTLEITVEASVA